MGIKVKKRDWNAFPFSFLVRREVFWVVLVSYDPKQSGPVFDSKRVVNRVVVDE